MAEEAAQRRRVADRGWLARAWQFVDDSQLDAHVLTVFLGWGTYKVTAWAFAYTAAHAPSSDVALVLGAVLGPWSLLQGAAVKFYFDARK